MPFAGHMVSVEVDVRSVVTISPATPAAPAPNAAPPSPKPPGQLEPSFDPTQPSMQSPPHRARHVRSTGNCSCGGVRVGKPAPLWGQTGMSGPQRGDRRERMPGPLGGGELGIGSADESHVAEVGADAEAEV